MEMLAICLLCFIGSTIATREGTASILTAKCDEEYQAATQDILAMADAARERVNEELGGPTKMFLGKVFLQRQEGGATLTVIKIKIRHGPPRDNTGRYIHLYLLDGGFLDVQVGKKRKDCFGDINIGLPDEPSNDEVKPIFVEVINEICGNGLDPVEYKLVQDDEDVLAIAKMARPSYEEEYGEQAKWDSSVYIQSGMDYAIKIRVRKMKRDEKGFIHIFVNSNGDFVRRQEEEDGSPYFGRKACIEIPPPRDAPELGEQKFAIEMTERCDRQYFKVVGELWDNIKAIKETIAADLGSPNTKFQPRIYIQEGDDIFMKIRVLGFADDGPRYIHVHLNAAGEYVGLEDGKNRKTCIEAF
ncbi:unnamed protein product [Owenia fusiformis]|uniref:Uncharacterized protein n=1 Tax=Owenia fusiformis TaxID=6347 RepID=A0A8J1XWC0_OWEFU|nr:unnamed protein product [Owenia fusiformis]